MPGSTARWRLHQQSASAATPHGAMGRTNWLNRHPTHCKVSRSAPATSTASSRRKQLCRNHNSVDATRASGQAPASARGERRRQRVTTGVGTSATAAPHALGATAEAAGTSVVGSAPAVGVLHACSVTRGNSCGAAVGQQCTSHGQCVVRTRSCNGRGTRVCTGAVP